MRITPKTQLGTLIEDHPELADILRWYEVPLRPDDLLLTLGEFCRSNELDLDDMLVEFQEALEDD